ncbi:MAG: ROK family protein [Phycisphaeraceae bacterium]|nr:ROK family protein [Phycisphaeraceae bacterium]
MNDRLGIDIGGSCAKLALLRQSQQPRTLRSEAYGDDPIAVVRQAVVRLTQGRLDEIAAAGISVAGPVDEQGRLLQAVNLPWLVGQLVSDWWCDLIGRKMPCRVLTDASAAALAEHAVHPVQGRAIYLSLGTGVGAAVLDDGKPLIFTRGTPGHFGHIDVSGGDPDAPYLPTCGRGGLEAYVGAQALRDADRADHPAMRTAIAALARAVRIALAIYRPQQIVLMGGSAERFEPVLDELRQLISRDLTPAAPAQWDISISTVGPFAAALGAARCAQPSS